MRELSRRARCCGQCDHQCHQRGGAWICVGSKYCRGALEKELGNGERDLITIGVVVSPQDHGFLKHGSRAALTRQGPLVRSRPQKNRKLTENSLNPYGEHTEKCAVDSCRRRRTRLEPLRGFLEPDGGTKAQAQELARIVRRSGSGRIRGHALQLPKRVKWSERDEFEAHQVRLAERQLLEHVLRRSRSVTFRMNATPLRP